MAGSLEVTDATGRRVQVLTESSQTSDTVSSSDTEYVAQMDSPVAVTRSMLGQAQQRLEVLAKIVSEHGERYSEAKRRYTDQGALVNRLKQALNDMTSDDIPDGEPEDSWEEKRMDRR